MRAFACVLLLSVPHLLRGDPGPLSISFAYPGVPGFESSGTATENKSWYTTGLPVGNGKLVAMAFGGVGNEWIQFNEDTIWCGQPHDYTNPNTTPARLAEIQDRCFNFLDIASYQQYLFSSPSRLPVYECPGALKLTFPHSSYTGYLRSLNLSNATVNVSYGTGKNAMFARQIVIGSGKPFSKSGDSGSLIVTNDSHAYPVGLLFAGGTGVTIANPIDSVLDSFNATIDGTSR